MAKGNLWMALIAIALIAVAGVYVYQSLGPAIPQTGLPGAPGAPSAPSGSAGCNLATSVVNAVTDTLTPGTSITPSSANRINGAYIGTTAISTVGTADILYNASGYISNIKTGIPINCGANLVANTTMYAYANATPTYYSNNGLTALVQSTANETAQAAGGSYNWKVHLQGTDKKSTGKQLFIVELSVPANVSSVSLNGGQVVAVPNGYTRTLSNGYAAAFLLPAITGNTAVDYNLAVASATGKVVTGQVYTTIYSLEPFVETDGTFSDVGNAFNSVNTAKYHDVQTKNFIIA